MKRSLILRREALATLDALLDEDLANVAGGQPLPTWPAFDCVVSGVAPCTWPCTA